MSVVRRTSDLAAAYGPARLLELTCHGRQHSSIRAVDPNNGYPFLPVEAQSLVWTAQRAVDCAAFTR